MLRLVLFSVSIIILWRIENVVFEIDERGFFLSLSICNLRVCEKREGEIFVIELFVIFRYVILCILEKVFFFMLIRFLLVIWRFFKYGIDIKFFDDMFDMEFLFKIKVERFGRIVLFL